ncbi:MAG: hypothetical protein LBR07_02365 [Puniceicoccales bacterium]|nr:hypothetical protein [Puniceicoccales bacterium]
MRHALPPSALLAAAFLPFAAGAAANTAAGQQQSPAPSTTFVDALTESNEARPEFDPNPLYVEKRKLELGLFAGIQVGGWFVSPTDSSARGDNVGKSESYTLYGGSLTIGFKPLKNLQLSIDAGYYTGGEQKTSFRWNGETSGGYWANDLISQKTEFEHIPIFLNAVFAPSFGRHNDFHLYVGPSIGVTRIAAETSFLLDRTAYDPSGAEAPYVYPTKPYYEPGDTVADPRYKDRSASKFIFSAGVLLGASWDITENFNLGLHYRFAWNSDLKFKGLDYGSTIGHQVALSAVWRF